MYDGPNHNIIAACEVTTMGAIARADICQVIFWAAGSDQYFPRLPLFLVGVASDLSLHALRNNNQYQY